MARVQLPLESVVWIRKHGPDLFSRLLLLYPVRRDSVLDGMAPRRALEEEGTLHFYFVLLNRLGYLRMLKSGRRSDRYEPWGLPPCEQIPC